MIKKFIAKLLGKPGRPAPAVPRGKRVEVPKCEHGIDPALVDERAARSSRRSPTPATRPTSSAARCATCCSACGPKDFDVATNATPEQVKALFRRAFIIGRRFRIVHVVFGRGRQDRGLSEVIEVSTFRAVLDAAAAEQVERQREDLAHATSPTRATSSTPSGRVLRDNVWGPQIEDAARRDFTDQRDVLRPGARDRGRLPRRHQGREEEAAAHDRRPGRALPRGSGAHHPRGPLRRQARLRDRAEDAGADPRDGGAARQRAAVAHCSTR